MSTTSNSITTLPTSTVLPESTAMAGSLPNTTEIGIVTSNDSSISMPMNFLAIAIGAVLILLVSLFWSCKRHKKTIVTRDGSSPSSLADFENGTYSPGGENSFCFTPGNFEVSIAGETKTDNEISGKGQTQDGLMNDLWKTMGSDVENGPGYSQDAQLAVADVDVEDQRSQGLFVTTDSEDAFEIMLYDNSKRQPGTSTANGEGEGSLS